MGLIASMKVGPTTSNFDGVVVSETVTPSSNSCPANIPTLQSNYVCQGSANFTIGQGGGTVTSGIQVPDISNQFWDDHVMRVKYATEALPST